MKARIGNQAVAAMALVTLLISGPAWANGNKDSRVEWASARQLMCSTVVNGLRTPYDHPTLIVAQSACQWQAAMAILAASGALDAGPEAEPPSVNWATQTAVVVAMGKVPYGYSLSVLGARQDSGVLLLGVHVEYQSTENNLEDVSPAAVLLVDGHGMNTIQALYDLEIPGLLDQAAVTPCGMARSGFGLRRTGGSLETGSTVSTTWGSLKSAYR